MTHPGGNSGESPPPREAAVRRLREAQTLKERAEAIEMALLAGMGMREIENLLDWRDNQPPSRDR